MLSPSCPTSSIYPTFSGILCLQELDWSFLHKLTLRSHDPQLVLNCFHFENLAVRQLVNFLPCWSALLSSRSMFRNGQLKTADTIPLRHARSELEDDTGSGYIPIITLSVFCYCNVFLAGKSCAAVMLSAPCPFVLIQYIIMCYVRLKDEAAERV